jgi:phosphoenolpyruvate synthase/pyruvate phosphate dikinase
MTEPEDVEIMRKAEAVVTIEGGPTCHAAIVCVTMGVPCLTGVEKISKTFTLDGKKLKNGLRVSITRDQITFEIPNGEKK